VNVTWYCAFIVYSTVLFVDWDFIGFLERFGIDFTSTELVVEW
jgi:hypothetical protein